MVLLCSCGGVCVHTSWSSCCGVCAHTRHVCGGARVYTGAPSPPFARLGPHRPLPLIPTHSARTGHRGTSFRSKQFCMAHSRRACALRTSVLMVSPQRTPLAAGRPPTSGRRTTRCARDRWQCEMVAGVGGLARVAALPAQLARSPSPHSRRLRCVLAAPARRPPTSTARIGMTRQRTRRRWRCPRAGRGWSSTTMR